VLQGSLSHAEPDAGSTLSVGRPLLHSDILPDKTGDFMRLLRLQPSDTLLHQIAALHVEVECALFGLDLSGGDHLGVRIMVQCFLKDARRLNLITHGGRCRYVKR